MCNQWCIQLVEKAKPFIQEDQMILEVGSMNVNGTPRSCFPDIARGKYLGIDLREGKDVDRILDVRNLLTVFQPETFGTVISTEMLEHREDWREGLFQMLSVLKHTGIFVLSTRSPGFPLHDYPSDHWRFTKLDFINIFSGIGFVLVLEIDPCCDVGIVLRKRISEEALKEWRLWLEGIEVSKPE